MTDLATTINQPTGTDHRSTDLSIEGLNRPPVPRLSPARKLAVSTVVGLLIAGSFVLGRVSGNNSGVEHTTGQTPSAGLSLQGARQAQARLVQANGTETSGSGQTTAAGLRLQAERQEQARLVQANGAEVTGSGRNLLSVCQVGVPC